MDNHELENWVKCYTGDNDPCKYGFVKNTLIGLIFAFVFAIGVGTGGQRGQPPPTTIKTPKLFATELNSNFEVI